MIDGELFEADLTSGGPADLPQFSEDQIQTLDYKSLRYPGHFDWAQELIRETPQIDAARLTSRFMERIPFHEEDRIIIYVSVSGVEDQKTVELVRHKEVLPLLKNQVYLDRKSTRLNSSHVAISYAVFCLKKKKTATEQVRRP